MGQRLGCSSSRQPAQRRRPFNLAPGRAIMEVRGVEVVSGTDVRRLVAEAGLQGPAYFHFPASQDLPLEEVARLARRVEPWVECSPQNVADALDLAVAGAARVVVRFGSVPPQVLAEIAETMGAGFLLRSEKGNPEAAAALARELNCELLLSDESEAPIGVPTWRLTEPGPGRFLLDQVGVWADDAAPDDRAPSEEE